MTSFANRIRGGLLLCLAATLFSAGCQSANSSANASGVSQNNSNSWGMYGSQPKKPNTPADFIGGERVPY
jgi:hypothetical protein